MNSLVLAIQYGHQFGRKFRKTLPLDYKHGNKHSHKNPHAIQMKRKHQLVNVPIYDIQDKRNGDFKLIKEIQRNSLKPFGKFTKSGFKFEKEKLPFYDIPDITGFYLQPYVAYLAPRLNQKLAKHQQNINIEAKKKFLETQKQQNLSKN